jgi:hypothetical protein
MADSSRFTLAINHMPPWKWQLNQNQIMEIKQMKKPTIKDINTPETIALVKAYLKARAYAETMRAKVDEIHREILTECPIYADKRDGGDQILESKNLYLSNDDAACEDFYEESDRQLRAAGLKPDEMKRDFCPALVAEGLLRNASAALVDHSGKPFGLDNDRILCSSDGLNNRQKWIDNIVNLILSMHPEITTQSLLASK